MNIYEFMMALGLNGSIEDLPNMDLSMMSKEESKMRKIDGWNFLERENKADVDHWKQKYDNGVANVNDENQTLINTMKDEIAQLHKDKDYLLKRVREAEKESKDFKDSNEIYKKDHAVLLKEYHKLVEERNELLNCKTCTLEEAENYIPAGICVECENLNLTINNWPEPINEDEE